jgi:hypothetical protein
VKLSSVALRNPASVSAVSQTTLLHTEMELEFDTEVRCVAAKPRNGRPLQMIPLENITSMVPLTPELEKMHAAKLAGPSLNGLIGISAAEVKAREDAAAARRAAAPTGVVKFVKGDNGSVVEKVV